MYGPTNDSGIKNFDAAEVITPGLLVKLDSDGDVSIADVTESPLGACHKGNAFAIGDNIAIAMTSKPGTVMLKAAGAFAVGATLYGRNGGLVDDDSADSAVAVAVAHTAATASGDLIEASWI